MRCKTDVKLQTNNNQTLRKLEARILKLDKLFQLYEQNNQVIG